MDGINYLELSKAISSPDVIRAAGDPKTADSYIKTGATYALIAIAERLDVLIEQQGQIAEILAEVYVEDVQAICTVKP